MSKRQRVLVLLAFFLVPLAVGAATVMSRLDDRIPPTNIGDGIELPAARSLVTTLPLAVVLVGNHGTEITDTLPVIEMLGASGAFEVRVVAPRREVSAFFNAGLDFVPDLGFDDYRRLVGRPPDLVVVPYLLQWKTLDLAVVDWLRENTGPGTAVLSICAGAEITAASGLFDGHRATANDANIEALMKEHRGIRWVRDVRWVHDRLRFSSGTLAAGIDATLAAITALAGDAATKRALAATSYPHVRFLADPRATDVGKGPAVLLEAAFRWETTYVGVVLGDGVSESAVSGMMEAYAATISSTTVALGARRDVIRSRHGVALVPRRVRSDAEDLDHLITLDPSERRFGYDLALEQVERTHGGPRARMAGELMNYPPYHLDLGGGVPVGWTMALRALLLGLLAALLAAGAGNLYVRHRHGALA